MRDIFELLGELGFEKGEVQAYTTLLQSGPLAVATLGKRLGVPRTTVYTMLERLRGRGLVRESTRKGLKIFLAEPPDSLNHIFSQRLMALEKAQSEFSKILPDLRAKRVHAATAPRLTVMDGTEGLQSLLRDMLLYSDIQTCSVWPIKKMMEVLSPEFFHLHNKIRIQRNIYTRAVWPKNESVSIRKHPFMGWGKEFKREVRIAPESMNYFLGYWIYANKVAFLSSAREGYGFIIQSEELAQTLTAQFELLWQASAPLEFDKKDVNDFLKEVSGEK